MTSVIGSFIVFRLNVNFLTLGDLQMNGQKRSVWRTFGYNIYQTVTSNQSFNCQNKHFKIENDNIWYRSFQCHNDQQSKIFFVFHHLYRRCNIINGRINRTSNWHLNAPRTECSMDLFYKNWIEFLRFTPTAINFQWWQFQAIRWLLNVFLKCCNWIQQDSTAKYHFHHSKSHLISKPISNF